MTGPPDCRRVRLSRKAREKSALPPERPPGAEGVGQEAGERLPERPEHQQPGEVRDELRHEAAEGGADLPDVPDEVRSEVLQGVAGRPERIVYPAQVLDPPLVGRGSWRISSFWKSRMACASAATFSASNGFRNARGGGGAEAEVGGPGGGIPGPPAAACGYPRGLRLRPGGRSPPAAPGTSGPVPRTPRGARG